MRKGRIGQEIRSYGMYLHRFRIVIELQPNNQNLHPQNTHQTMRSDFVGFGKVNVEPTGNTVDITMRDRAGNAISNDRAGE
jgi:hypothetical protein